MPTSEVFVVSKNGVESLLFSKLRPAIPGATTPSRVDLKTVSRAELAGSELARTLHGYSAAPINTAQLLDFRKAAREVGGFAREVTDLSRSSNIQWLSILRDHYGLKQL
jgi:hypothetical protein